MCMNGCGGLFEEGVRLDKVKCPCGRGYWDVWKAAFVTGDEIRAQKAPPKDEYIARVKAELSKEEYEAKIRHQYICHFFGCDVKRSLDDRATNEGRNNGSSLRRAITEWWEYSRGDFCSKGTSRDFDVDTLKAVWGDLRGFPVTDDEMRPLLPQKTSTDDKQEVGGRDRVSAPRTTPGQAPKRRHSSTSDQTPRSAVAPGAQDTYRDYFIPEQKLRRDVLNDHCKRGIFGPGATVEQHKHQDGRHGFLIRSIIPPTAVSIRLLMEDSEKVDDVERKNSESVGESPEDDQQDQKSSRPQDRDIRESSSRHSSDTLARAVDTMTISSRNRRHTQYRAPIQSSVARSAQSTSPTYSQSPPRHEPRHSRLSRESVEEHEDRTIDDEPTAEPDARRRRKQTDSSQWLCCQCNKGSYAWPDIKRCPSCLHDRCSSCGKDDKTSASDTRTVQRSQETEDSPTESRTDPRARRPKDDTRRPSKTDRRQDKNKDSQDPRR